MYNNWNQSYKIVGAAPINTNGGNFRGQAPRSGSDQHPPFQNQTFTQNFGNGNSGRPNRAFQQFNTDQSFGNPFSSQQRNSTIQSGNQGSGNNTPFGNFQNRQQSQNFDNNQRGGNWGPGNNSSGFQNDSFQQRQFFNAQQQSNVPRFERNQHQNSMGGLPSAPVRAQGPLQPFQQSGDSYGVSSNQSSKVQASPQLSQPQQTESAFNSASTQPPRVWNSSSPLPRQEENSPAERRADSDKVVPQQDTIFNKVGSAAQSESIPGLGEVLGTEKKLPPVADTTSNGPHACAENANKVENAIKPDEKAVDVKNEKDSKPSGVQPDAVTDLATTKEVGSVNHTDEVSAKLLVENNAAGKEKIGEEEKLNTEDTANKTNSEETTKVDSEADEGEPVKSKALSHSKAAMKSQIYDMKTLQDFDKKFADWEKQFEAWKRANANHKDRDAYDRYIKQFTQWGNTLAKQRQFILHEIEKQKIRNEMEKARAEKAAIEKAALEIAAKEKAILEKAEMELIAKNLKEQSRFPIPNDQALNNFQHPKVAHGGPMDEVERTGRGSVPAHGENECNVTEKTILSNSQTFDLNSVPDSLLTAIAKTLGNNSSSNDELKNNQMQTSVPFANLGDIAQQQQPPAQAMGPNPFDIRHNNMGMNIPFNRAPNLFETASNVFSGPRFGSQPVPPIRIPRVSVFDDDRGRPSHLGMRHSFNNEPGPSRLGFGNEDPFSDKFSAGNRDNPFEVRNVDMNPFAINQPQQNPFSSSFTRENPWDSQSNRVPLRKTSANPFEACNPSSVPFNPPPVLSNPMAAADFIKDDTVKARTLGEVEFVRIKRVRDLPLTQNVLIEDDTDASLEVIDYGHGSAGTEVPDIVDDISRYVERESMDSFDDCRRPRSREGRVTIDYGHGSAEDGNQHWSGRQYSDSPPYPLHPRDYYDGPHGDGHRFDPDEDIRHREMLREDDIAFVRPKRRFGPPDRFEDNYPPREYEDERHRPPPPARKHPTPPQGRVAPPPGRVAPPRPSNPLSPELILSGSDSDSLPEVLEVIPSNLDSKAEDDKNRRVKVAPPRDMASPKSGGRSRDSVRPPSDRDRREPGRRGAGRERENDRSRERTDKDADRDKSRLREREKDTSRSNSRRSERENDDKRPSRIRENSPRRDNSSKSPARSNNRDSLQSDSPRADTSRSNTHGPVSSQTGPIPTEPTRAQTVLIEDILSVTGRKRRPAQIVIILRGLPGSGKSYVSKLIKDREVELGGSAPRILSLDDYFMTDEVEKVIKDPVTGKDTKETVTEYEYDAEAESSYRADLIKTFKKTVDGGFFPFIIVDSVNEKLKYFDEMATFASKRRFQVYIAEMNETVEDCLKRNIHNRRKDEIVLLQRDWEATPNSYVKLDVRTLLQDEAVEDVEMEDVYDTKATTEVKCVAVQESEVAIVEEGKEKTASDDPSGSAVSKWEKVDPSEEKLNKLDGLVRKRKDEEEDLKEMSSIESWLQRNLPDDYSDRTEARIGQKRVRWADIEERREQERMRDIGFVVGHTDWNRMTDPTFGSSALTKTKFI